METKNTQGLKPVSELNWFEMKAEATKRGLKTNGVSKQELTVALQKARNAENTNAIFKRQQPGPSTGNNHPNDKKTIVEAIERPKHVVVSKDVADVLGAKAIENKPQLSQKSKQKIDQPKTNPGGVKIRVNDNPGLTAQQIADQLNSGAMGLPQRRERVFFIALRKDLAPPFLKQIDMFTEAPELNLVFNFPEVVFSEIYEPNGEINKSNKLAKSELLRLELRQPGDRSLVDCDFRLRGKGSFFNQSFIYKDKVLATITATKIGQNILFDEPRKLTKKEFCLAGSYPLDYEFLKNEPGYLIGMSVPPIMVANIVDEVFNQWLQKLK